MDLSPAEIQSFVEQGYLHLRDKIAPKECLQLILRMRELTERRCAQKADHFFETGSKQSADEFFLASSHKISFFFDKQAPLNAHKPNFQLLNKVGHALHNLCPVYGKFSFKPVFGQWMKALGQKKPLLVQSMFIFKQSQFGDAVPSHQDASFLYTDPDSVIGLWFALEDATEENGCLWALPGGHVGKLKNRFIKSGDALRFDHEQKVFWPKEKFVPLPAKRGDIILLHGLVPHFSKQNYSSHTRFAYTIHFIDQKCHYPKTNWLDISQN